MKRLSMFLTIALLSSCSSSDSSVEKKDAANDAQTVEDATTQPDDGAKGTLSDSELIEACVRSTACGVRAYPSMTNCIDAYHKLYVRRGISAAYDSIYRCINAAGGDCDAVAKCFGIGEQCDRDFEASCNGKVAISCDLIDKRVYKVDCTPTGLDCAVKTDESFTAVCTPGSCSPGYEERCSGDVHRSCAAGVIETRDCTLDGFVCVETKDVVGCAGNQDTRCVASVTPKCEEDVAVSCELVRVHRRDCAAEGLTCEAGECVGDTSQLCDSAPANRCAGDALEVCVGDGWQKVDCGELGLGPCEVAPDADWARCSKP